MSDQNESRNRRAPNSAVDSIDESHALSELERIGSRVGRQSQRRSQLEDRMRTEGNLLNKLTADARQSPFIKEGPLYEEQVGSLRSSIRGIRSQMNTLDVTGMRRAESEASTFIARQFSNPSLNSQIGSMQRDASVQNRAFSMSGMSYDELSNRRESVFAQIRGIERGALNEVKGAFSRRGEVNPERSAAIGVAFSSTQEKMREIASINAAQQMQRLNENDPTSTMKRIMRMGADANKVLGGGVSISEGGMSRTVAPGAIGSEIVDQSKQLAAALRELNEGISRTDEELAKFRAQAEESASNLEKLKQAQSGGGGGFNGYSVAMGLAGGFNAVGSAVQQISVGQRIGQMQNISGYAGIENQKYSTYQQGRGGDVLSQLMLSQYAGAEGFGRQLKAGTNTALSAYAASGAAQTAAGGMQLAEGIKSYFNPAAQALGTSGSAAQNIVSGAQTTVQGLSTGSTMAADLARGVSANQAALGGVGASLEARRALLQVSASQLQGFRDFSVGMGGAAMGMGRGAQSFLSRTVSQGNMQSMIDAGLSPEQFASGAQFGVNSIGSTFNESQIFASRNLEKAGYGPMEQNLQRISTLAQAGSNNPQAGLGSVLEAAFSKGLDNSKALNLVVEHTANMVKTSSGAAMGIDTTGASAAMLAAGVDPNIANREFAVQRAATAGELARGMSTNTNVSFSGMVNTSRISQTLGMSGEEAIITQGIDPQTLRSLQGKSGEDVSKFFRQKGVDISPNKASNTLESLLDLKGMSMLEAGGAGFAQNVNSGSLLKKIKSGEKLSGSEELQLGKVASLSGFTSADELSRQVGGLFQKPTPNGIGEAARAMQGKGDSEMLKTIDEMRTSGFKQLSEAAMQATKNFNSAADALKALGELSKGLEKIGAGGGEAQFANAGSEAARTFGRSTMTFERAVNKFNQKIDSLVTNSGISAADYGSRYTEDLLKSTQDAMNQKKGN